MMLKLAKTDINPLVKDRIIRMRDDAAVLQLMTVAQIRAVYADLEVTRDCLSLLLDKADGKI
jgi:hypothetical protein